MTDPQFFNRRRFVQAVAGSSALLGGRLLTAGSTATGVAAATVPAAVAHMQEGGNWSLPILTDPVMNPVIAQGRESNWTNALLFSQLVKPSEDVPGEVAPDLAESWETSEDGLTWTFRLRSDVAWHDGEPFTAGDVKFTFDTILDDSTNTRLRADLQPIEQIEAPDETTVVFTLREAYAPFLTFLGYTAGIVPAHILEGQDINTAAEFNTRNPVGTGPFKLRSYTSASEVVLEANPDYFLGPPNLDTVTLKIMPDTNSQIVQLNTGGLDWAQIAPFNTVAIADNPDLELFNFDQFAWWHISPNTTLPFFGDKRVRQALTHALDREAISANVSNGTWPVQGSAIPPFLTQWHNTSVTPYPYDPDRALALLEEAGWTKGSDGVLQQDGQPFRFTLSWGRIEGREEIGTFVQQYWQALGLDVTAEGVEWSAMLARFAERDYEAFLDRWVAPLTPDLYNYFHSSAAQGGKNSAVYSNPEVDRLLEEGRTTLDPEASRGIYMELQELLHEEQPQVFLFWHPDTQVRRQGYTGIPEMAMSNGDMLTYAHEFAKVE